MLRNKLLKVLTSRSNVHLSQCSRCLYPTASRNDHDVCVASEHVDVRREVRVAHLHPLELRLRLRAAYLELLDNIRDSLKSVTVKLLRTTTTQPSDHST